MNQKSVDPATQEMLQHAENQKLETASGTVGRSSSRNAASASSGFVAEFVIWAPAASIRSAASRAGALVERMRIRLWPATWCAWWRVERRPTPITAAM